MGKGFKLASVPIIDYNYKVPYKELFTHLQLKQKEYDENVAKVDALEDSWLTLQTVPGEEQLGLNIQKSYDDKINNITNMIGGDFSLADGLIRDVTRELKRDMTSGTFAKVQGNYKNYKALTDYLNTAVNESDPNKRVERDRADKWLNMSLMDFYTQGGTEGGASFSSKKPLTYVDINDKINNFLSGWKPDTSIGNIIKRDDGSGNITYEKQQGRYDANGMFYYTDSYEVANPDEIRTAIVNHIESDPMALQYIEEGVMLDMQGITPELLDSDEGKDYVRTAREELTKLPQFTKEDVNNMNDMSVIANAMKYSELQNMAEPFVDREGYEKHTQTITKIPEYFYKLQNGITVPDPNAAATFSSYTPLISSDVNRQKYDNVQDLMDDRTSLQQQLEAQEVLINDYQALVNEDPNNISALTMLGQAKSKKDMILGLLSDMDNNYKEIVTKLDESMTLEELPVKIENIESDYFDDTEVTQEYKGQFAEFKNSAYNEFIGPNKVFKNEMEFFQGIVDHISGGLPGTGRGANEDTMPWFYPWDNKSNDEKLKDVMQGMMLLYTHPTVFSRSAANLGSGNAGAASAWDTPIKQALKFYGIWDDDLSDEDNFKSYRTGFAWSHIVQNGLNNHNAAELLSELEQSDIPAPEQVPYINFGTDNEGVQSLLSKKISRMYTTDRESFVVYDIQGRQILDYDQNPADLILDGVLQTPFGDGGHWIRAYKPIIEDGEIARDDNNNPKYESSYLVSVNPYVGTSSQIFDMIADELSLSNDTETVEISNRLREQQFNNSLGKFEVLNPPAVGDGPQSVTVPIGDDDHLRIDRTTFGESANEEYRIYHEDHGGYITNNNGSEIVYYSLQEVREAYRALHSHILGAPNDNNISNNPNTNLNTNISRQSRSDFLQVEGASAGITNLSNKYGFNSQDLLRLIEFETAGTFSPAIQNSSSGATGLIQFMGDTAKSLGTTTSELKTMSVEEQMKWVDKYFERQLKNFPELEGMHPYLWVAAPAISKLPYDWSVLWNPNDKEAKANPSWQVKSGDISNQNGAPVGSVTRYSILSSLN